jgi:hypothetical protein
MTKEQLAEQYCNKIYQEAVKEDMYAPDVYQSKKDFIAGFAAAEPKWISVSEQYPPNDVELLVKSPEGVVHLASWRESYNIFTCQDKNESSYDWKYMEIPQ